MSGPTPASFCQIHCPTRGRWSSAERALSLHHVSASAAGFDSFELDDQRHAVPIRILRLLELGARLVDALTDAGVVGEAPSPVERVHLRLRGVEVIKGDRGSP